MTPIETPITDDEHWHALRRKHIGSSDIAPLLNQSTYATRFMLFHEKRSGLRIEPNHERLWWGKHLEPIIALKVAEKMRWNLEARRVYLSHPTVSGMGCTVDRFVVDHEDGPGVAEIKSVDWMEFRDNWSEERAPPHIELQLQHQLAVTGYPWGVICCLIVGGGFEIKYYPRKPLAAAHETIAAEVAAFWKSIENDDEPEPIGAPLELPFMRLLSNPTPENALEGTCDLSGDNEAPEIVEAYAWAREQEGMHKRIKEGAYARLLNKIRRHKDIIMPGWKITRRRDGPIYKCEADGTTPSAPAIDPAVLGAG